MDYKNTFYNDDNILLKVIKEKNLYKLQQIIKTYDINAKDENGITILFHAIQFSNFDIIKSIIENGADFNIKNNYNISPLMVAASIGDEQTIEYLVSRNANIDFKDYKGQTALNYSRNNKNNETNNFYLMNSFEITCIFLAYMIIADGNIDDYEVELLKEFISENGLNEEILSSVDKIFCDSNDKIPIDKIFLKLSSFNNSTIKEVIFSALIIAISDGDFSSSEKQILNQLIDVTKFEKNEYLKIISDAEKYLESLSDKSKSIEKNNSISGSLIKKISESISNYRYLPEIIKDNLEYYANNILLDTEEYPMVINKCKDIAKGDLEHIQKIHLENNKYLTDLSESINLIISQNNLYTSDKEIDEYKNNLVDIQKILNELLDECKKTNNEALKKKLVAINYYTISFIGKTKAGKSTLHSIITGRGYESIGDGKQRTTRFNRRYIWKNVRIIDTPGIGAPGGKNDEEIVKSIIDESDLICYVLKNDSIQETEFSFLKFIKNKNKPIVILLNIKEDIENETRFKKFLDNPEFWHNRTDEKNIQGHINRIKTYVQKYYNEDYFEIFPVQLLAAKISKFDKYKENSKKLYNASHMEPFLKKIRLSILEEGLIKRSQTIIDGSISNFYETLFNISKIGQFLSKLQEKFQQKLNDLANKFENHKQSRIKALIQATTDSFTVLYDNLYSFSTQNYSYDEKKIRISFEEYINKFGLDESISNSYKKIVNEHFENIKNFVEEVSEDLSIFANNIKITNLNYVPRSTTCYRSYVKGLSALLSLAAGICMFFPPAWPVSLGLGLASLIAWGISYLFSSKEELDKEAINHLYNTLNETLTKYKDELKMNLEFNFNKAHSEIVDPLLKNLSYLIKGLIPINESIKALQDKINMQLEHLNKLFAWRILNFMKNKNSTTEILDLPSVDKDILNVKRDFGKNFEITHRNNYFDSSNPNVNKISKVLQETIILKKGDNNADR